MSVIPIELQNDRVNNYIYENPHLTRSDKYIENVYVLGYTHTVPCVSIIIQFNNFGMGWSVGHNP